MWSDWFGFVRIRALLLALRDEILAEESRAKLLLLLLQPAMRDAVRRIAMQHANAYEYEDTNVCGPYR